MKKLYIAMIALLGAAACQDKDINLASRVILSQTEDLEIEAENVPTLDVAVISDGDWVVVTPEWISANPRYGSGDGMIQFNFDDNYVLGSEGNLEMGSDREATVSVECASGATSFLVKQAGDPMKGNVYVPVTAVKDGGVYLLVAVNAEGALVAARAISGNYGYLYVDETMGTEEKISMPTEDNGFLFTAVDGGWTIQQKVDNRYLYQTGSHNSFNVSNTRREDGDDVWTVSFDADGYATVTNVFVGKWMQYSQSYKSYGSYPTAQDSGVLPRLYEKVENQ